PPRPNPLCCGWDYSTWEGLTNTRWTSRHLPPKEQPTDPAPERVADELFARNGPMIESEKSTLIFPYFAQWFTDGFLSADTFDRRRNHSNHQIDLCQLYGHQPETTCLVREMTDGRMKSQLINGAEFPPFLFEQTSEHDIGDIKPEFRKKRETFEDFFNLG